MIQIEAIRRAVLANGNSQRKVAKELGHSRKTIRKALDSPEVQGYCLGKERERTSLIGFESVILGWIEADRSAPRKQRHTAQRIYERLCEEHDYTGSIRSVSRYVRKVKGKKEDVYYPLSFSPGEEAQVDWGEAWVDIDNVRTKVYLFCMRLCHSRAVFVRAYPHMKMEAFLDGHVRAFSFFGGVPRRCAYDNLKSAVISVGRGKSRKLNQRFLTLRSHYLFTSRFCNVASGWEKGYVENLVKLAQRSFMTPVPSISSIESLNLKLMDDCTRYIHKPERFTKLEAERTAFLPLPDPFRACVYGTTFINKLSMIQAAKSFYSVPVKYAHEAVRYSLYVDRIEIYHRNECIATHKRSYIDGNRVLDPWHYVPLLERKPGGIYNAEAFSNNAFGRAFTLLRRELESRYDENGTYQFIRVLRLTEDHPVDEVVRAVELCVRKRIYSVDAIISELGTTLPDRIENKVIDISRHPGLKVTTTGLRPAEEYDAVFNSPERRAEV